MSVKVMAWVWDHSRSKPTARLVLLAIADHANGDGIDAYPSMTQLARKTGLSERAVQGAIAELVALGELLVTAGGGRGHTNRYRVVMATPVNPARDAPYELNPERDAGYELNPASRAPYEVNPAGDAGYQLNPAGETPNGGLNPAGETPNELNPAGETPNESPLNPAGAAPRTVLEPSKRKNSPTESSSRPKLPERDDVEQVCRHLADRIEGNGSKRPRITRGWRDEARRLLDHDDRTVEQVIRAIDWCQDDPFWRSNILSMPKLRERYDQLRLAAQRSRQPGNQLAVPGAAPVPRPSTSRRKDAEAELALEELHAMRGMNEIR